VRVRVGVRVGVFVGVTVGVFVDNIVLVRVGVGVDVRVGVFVGVTVGVLVEVRVWPHAGDVHANKRKAVSRMSERWMDPNRFGRLSL
jgi:hypothetical protein